MGFEFENLKRPPVDTEYKPRGDEEDGTGLKMQLNLDLLTMSRMEEMEQDYNRALKNLAAVAKKPKISTENGGDEEETADADNSQGISIFHYEKSNIRFKARMLGGRPGERNAEDRYIRSWNLEIGGEKVEINYEFFEQMPVTVLNALYEFVTGEANSVSKKNAAP